jgi:EmrB/QacA subfamily drug resistance transporter
MNGTLGSEKSSAQVSSHVRNLTLVATILGSGIIFLDGTVVNVALPAIDRQLNAGLSGLQWVVDSYVLTLAALLIPGGSLGDRYGRRKIMVIGLAGFGVLSAFCGLSTSITWLISGRLLQGVAGALLVPGSLAILQATFPKGEARGRAIGQWSGWSGISAVIGPLAGGWIVDRFSWHWIFFINIPIILIAIFLMMRYVPESKNLQASKELDWSGVATITLGLGGLAYGLIEGPVAGWGSPLVLTGLIIGLGALLLFPLMENKTQSPMVPLRLFKSQDFSAANLTTLGVYFGLSGTTFFLVIYLQNVMGYSALNAGLVLAPISLFMLVLSPIFGRLAGRYGPRLFMTMGPIVCSLGLLGFLRVGPRSNYWTHLLPSIVIFGLGLATTVAPLTNTVISSVPARHSGVAAAFNNTISRVASLLAVASLGVIVTLSFSNAVVRQTQGLSLNSSEKKLINQATADPTGAMKTSKLAPEVSNALQQAYTQAFHLAMLVTAASVFAGGVIAGGFIRNHET